MQGVSNNTSNPQQSPVFALSAKVTVAAERATPSPEINRLDPSALARIAMEDELKRKGGGGGGGGAPKESSPTLFVLYSLTLMNKAIQAAFQDLMKSLNELLNPQQVNQNPAAQTPATNFIKGAIANFTGFFAGGFVQMQARLGQSLQDAMPDAAKLAKNIGHLANTISSAISNGLKKIFYTKDDTTVDPEKALYESEGGLLGSLVKSFGFSGNRDSDGNARSIDAHIENIARQLTKWSESFSYPIKEFSKRWFK